MADKSHSGTPGRRAGGNLLPEGWAFTSIENCIAEDGLISDGDWVESKDQDPTGSVRLIQLADVGDGIFRDKSERFMTPESASRLNCTYLKAGDVLVARMPDPLGRACIFPGVSNECVTVVDVCLVRTTSNSAILNTVLKYWINTPSFRAKIAENASGTTRKRITRKKLEKFEIPLPPLAEQKVIAEKLDTLLAQVDTTKARLERIPDIIKRFRQSVLAAAVSGRLTGVQVNSIGQIKDCASVVSGLAFKKAEYSNEGSRLLQIANVGYGCTKWDSPNYIPLELAESCLEYSMQAGDIVLALNRPITNDTLKVAWIRDEDLPATLYQRVARLRCNESLIDPRYLFLAMQSKEFLEVVSKNLKGSDQPYLNTSDLSSFSIAAPEKEEQTEIVRRVEELFAFADTIEQKAAAALERVNNLTQSIQAKAFRGELTADWRAANPELISDDNSAEALLAKIQAEREALKPVKKTRKKKAKA